MPKKRFSAEQIVTLLRQIEVSISTGKTTQIACREAGISEQSYYRWRQPGSLTLTALIESDLLASWAEQRNLLGLA